MEKKREDFLMEKCSYSVQLKFSRDPEKRKDAIKWHFAHMFSDTSILDSYTEALKKGMAGEEFDVTAYEDHCLRPEERILKQKILGKVKTKEELIELRDEQIRRSNVYKRLALEWKQQAKILDKELRRIK